MAAPMAALAAPPGPGKLTECQWGGGCRELELGDVALELNTETLESSVAGDVLDGLRRRVRALHGGPVADA